MAKIKLQLTPNPTFKAKVPVPVAGSVPVHVEFTFKHRDKEALAEFHASLKDLEDVDLILAMASGWELDDPFDAEHIAQLTGNYVGSALAILEKYIAESTGVAHRSKN